MLKLEPSNKIQKLLWGHPQGEIYFFIRRPIKSKLPNFNKIFFIVITYNYS